MTGGDVAGAPEFVTVQPAPVTLRIGPGDRVCPACRGQGAVGDCPYCRRGIQHQCQYCHEWLPGGWWRHFCDGRRDQLTIQMRAAEAREFDRATHLTVADAVAAGIGQVVWPGAFGGEYTGIDTIEEDADTLEDNTGRRPLFAWATTSHQIAFDAGGIIANARADLYETTEQGISPAAVKALQEFLDAWCVTYGADTTSYGVDRTRAVIVPGRGVNE